MLFGASQPAADFDPNERSFAKFTTIVSQRMNVELRIVTSSAGSTCRHSVWSAPEQRAKFWKVAPSIRIPCERFCCRYEFCTSGWAEPKPDRHWYVVGPQTPPRMFTCEHDAQ